MIVRLRLRTEKNSLCERKEYLEQCVAGLLLMKYGGT